MKKMIKIHQTKQGMLIKLANKVKPVKVLACNWNYIQVDTGKKILEWGYHQKGYYQEVEIIK